MPARCWMAPRDAGGDVQLRRDDLAGLADLPVVGRVARVDRGARWRRGRRRACRPAASCTSLNFSALPSARPPRDDDLGGGQFGPVALGDLAADEAALAAVGHAVGGLDRGAAAGGRRRIEAGGAHGDDLGRVAALHGGDGVAGVDRALEGVGAVDLGDVADLRRRRAWRPRAARRSCRWRWRGTGCGCSSLAMASTCAATFSARPSARLGAVGVRCTLATPAICAAALAASAALAPATSTCTSPPQAMAAVTVLRVARLDGGVVVFGNDE